MAKSQINQLSKRQILESLQYEQAQSSSTLSRLAMAIARASGMTAEQLADAFVADEANQTFVNDFNTAVKAKHQSLHKHEHADGESHDHDHAAPDEAAAE
jgi:hypothetical protein